ncbi:MAG: DUF721 domain-containing protein [Ferruginibacter sp.]
MGELSIQEAMQQFLKHSRLKHGIQAAQIEELWEGIMGKTIAKYTDKIQIIGSTLYVSSTVAALKNELVYQKEKIIEQVNAALGEKIIKDVVVK